MDQNIKVSSRQKQNKQSQNRQRQNMQSQNRQKQNVQPKANQASKISEHVYETVNVEKVSYLAMKNARTAELCAIAVVAVIALLMGQMHIGMGVLAIYCFVEMVNVATQYYYNRKTKDGVAAFLYGAMVVAAAVVILL